MSSDLLAFFTWYLASSVAGLAGLPLAFKGLRHLPDRGYSFARPLGLLVGGYAFWFLGSLGILRNDAGSILFATLLVGGLGAAWLGRAGLGDLRRWLGEQRAVVLGVEAVFLAAFALLAVVRAHNPEILGTEKPMEFMFLNSILRGPTFPPRDAWLSGYAVSYYYFGYVLVAALAKVTATTSAVAFNLALSLLFALTASGALGVVMNLIALFQSGRGEAEPSGAPAEEAPTGGRRLAAAFWPALLGPFFVLVVGNFYGLAQLAYQNGLFANTNIWTVRYYFGAKDPSNEGATAALSAQEPNVNEPGLRAGPVNLWDWLDLKETEEPPPTPTEWRLDTGGNWFFAARVLHDRDLLGNETEAIDEMPAFSFLLGDMHPHVLALPFVVLAAGLALEWLLWGRSTDSLRQPPALRSDASQSEADGAGGRRTTDDAEPEAGEEDRTGEQVLVGTGETPTPAPRNAISNPGASVHRDGFDLTLSYFRRPSSVVRLLLAGITLGGLSFLNTWDFPIYLFLTLLALGLGYGLSRGWQALLAALGRLAGVGAILGLLSVLLFFPFYLTFQSQAGGVLPNLVWPTRFQQSLVFFGPVLIGASVYLAWLGFRGRRLLDWRLAAWTAGGLVLLLALAAAALALGASFSPSLGGVVDQYIAPLSRVQALRLLLERRLVDSLATLYPAAMVGVCVGLAAGVLRRPGGTAPDAPPPAAAPAGPRNRAWRRRSSALDLLGGGHGGEAALRSPAVLMALAMVVTGALLMLGPEYVYLRDNFGWRMNTLFKFYFQTWTLWALAAAFGAWHLARFARRAVRYAGLGLLTLGVLGGLVYTSTSLYSKTGGFASKPTLDGMAYFAQRYPDDWAGIQWLRQNVSGTPTIVEAAGGAYNIEEGRIAMATGLPTVMGWVNHEGQWRGAAYSLVAARPEQIRALYQGRDWESAQAFLDRYGVEYVVVGSTERSMYNPVYVPKFDQHMQAVFESGSLRIYQRKPLQVQ